MLTLLSKKLFAAGIITIALPFGSFWVTATGAGVTQTQQPQTIQAQTNPTAVNSGIGSNSSYNWSGYQATGGTYTSISGTWTIPTVPSANTTEADATWVGVGGAAGARDLIQAGTQAVINGSGAPVYQAWYETLPQPTTQVPLTVSPGDSMSASITETSPTNGSTPAEWAISIRDNTTGQSYQTSLAYNSSLSSAEWIEEMPSDGSNFVPLDNFGTAIFSDGMTTVNGVSQTIAAAGAQELTMVNGDGQALATPSAIGSDGASFTVTRTSAPVTSDTGGGSGGGYYVITRGSGVGRGWRRTGVGVEGYSPRTAPTSSVGTAGTTGSNGAAWQSFYNILQQLRALQQQERTQFEGFRNGYLRR